VSGLDHPDTLTVRLNLAAWTERAGDAAGARDQLAELVLVEERVLGAEHPGTLLVRAGLAAWTGLAGMRRGAGPVRGAGTGERAGVRPGGPGRDTVTARAELASWTGEAGDAAGARDQFAALLPVIERMSGAEHTETLAARASLAFWTRQTEVRPPSSGEEIDGS
jgi:hypothetical protein